jgi:phosphoglycolate phosphatase
MSKKLQTRQEKLGDLVIFDFDGTLADTSQVFVEAFDKAAPAVGAVPYKRNEAAMLKQLDAYDVLQYHGVQPDRVPRFIELMRLEMSSRISGIQLFPNVLSVLSELVSGGHTLAVVTSNSRETVTAVIGEEFDKLFSTTCFNTPIAGKEEALKKLAFESKVAPSAAYYVGDELRDFRAASAAGINFIGVSWGFNTAHSLRRAGCPTIIDHLSELPALLSLQRSEDLTQHLNALYGYAMILSRNSATAADLVQETYRVRSPQRTGFGRTVP